MIKFLVCFVFFLVIFANNSFANDFNAPSAGEINDAVEKITPTRFLPGDFLYFTITVKESVSSFFKPSSLDKANFEFVLTSKRLKEVYLLYNKGDYKNSENSVFRYKNSIKKTVRQIDKAQAQNQDTKVLADKIANDLVYQDRLILFLLTSERKLKNEQELVSSFSELVDKIESIKPGNIDRYKVTESKKIEPPEKSPEPTEKQTSNPVYNPKRIIY